MVRIAAILRLAVDVAVVLQLLQQFRNGRCAHLMAHSAQRRRQLLVALRDPPQRPASDRALSPVRAIASLPDFATQSQIVATSFLNPGQTVPPPDRAEIVKSGFYANLTNVPVPPSAESAKLLVT